MRAKKIETYKNQKQEVTSMNIQCQLPTQDKQRNTKVAPARCPIKLQKYDHLLDALKDKYKDESLEKARMEQARIEKARLAARKNAVNAQKKYVMKRSEPMSRPYFKMSMGYAFHSDFKAVPGIGSMYVENAKASNTVMPRVELGGQTTKNLSFGVYLSYSKREFNAMPQGVNNDGEIIPGTYTFINMPTKSISAGISTCYEYGGAASNFKPYITASAGIARNSISYNHLIESRDVNITAFGKTRESFAWDVGVGLLTKVNNNLNIDLSFRYVDLGVASTSDKGTITASGEVHRRINDDLLTSTRLSSYVIALGFKYVF
ncbi:outer membrane beta-barrel protein [Candidatus Lariskella endosymbiont of Epinotia ramella]|uniref:outer membrane beta-barrel protein n=1 Tax=Candidatus Lariskella endosymbiont of Epinotia ramella TaxID=3066224 RepID=UPI0030D1BD4C